MARRKVVFVIVEGPTDEDALGVFFEKLLDKNQVFVHVVHGDVTSDYNYSSQNIRAAIDRMLSKFAKQNFLDKKVHFKQIIHIVDMDGAYIADNDIVEDPNAEKPFYELTSIRTLNPSHIRARNKLKRECLERLSTVREVGVVPYQAYYMSSNLDHVLYNRTNLTDEEKERQALLFVNRFRGNINGFVDFFVKSSFAVGPDYIKSWEFIKEDLHSLERYTNFGICLERILSEKTESTSSI